MAMTLQAIDNVNGENMIWVAVPLEMVDWMAARLSGPFTAYLASLDPYSSIKVAANMLSEAADELRRVLYTLRREKCDVPEVVDLFGQYGITRAKRTVEEMIDFFDAVSKNDWKVISIGD
jgi:hypothetical protein